MHLIIHFTKDDTIYDYYQILNFKRLLILIVLVPIKYDMFMINKSFLELVVYDKFWELDYIQYFNTTMS